MNFAIFGSCVSRDTCEFDAEVNVVAYIARHSVTSLRSPHGDGDISAGALESSFQQRMVTSDLRGDGLDRLISSADDLDAVLLDLVDERRGFWLFPNGTTMTNSLEVELCGADTRAEEAGARLVEFGTDEHFYAWRHGFSALVDGLKKAKLWERTVLLDIEWACALDGAPQPKRDTAARIGRRWRKLQRAARDASRSLSQGRGVGETFDRMLNVNPTEAEEFADRAARANAEYVRYREFARAAVGFAVTRRSDEVRIGQTHKWGPQPFHYRDEDYRSIIRSINEWLASKNGPRR